ncbi:MAG TPA: sensor domain-containing diguanylate cyclase [Magnetospirillum sp.]|nr:sensor domain-containing diguanylate cyclase [Magnetospirillum sp.]
MTVSWNSASEVQAAPISLPSPPALTDRTLSWVGLGYVALALLVLAAVVVGEYRSATDDILARLRLHEAASRAPLAEALASRRLTNVKAIVADVAASPYISGVAIQDADTGMVLTGRGVIVDESGRVSRVGVAADSDGGVGLWTLWTLTAHSFLIDTRPDGGASSRVRATFYSDGGAALDRLASRGTMIIGALVIQSAALWLLFLHVTRRTVSRPLARLSAQMHGLAFDAGVETAFVTHGIGKVGALEEAVREMRRHIKFEFRGLVENSLEGVAVIQEGRFRFANRAAAGLLGFDHPEALVLLPAAWEVFAPQDRARAERLFSRLAARLDRHAHAHTRLDLPVPGADGEAAWVQVRFQRVVWRGAPGLLLSLADITRHKRARDQLVRLATYDSLTGVVNRRHLVECANREMDRARRYGYPLAVLVLDIDHFKVINDTHGHGVGDIVLKRLAQKIVSILRDSDVLGRIGGEEFAILLPNTTLDGALILAERVRATVAAMDVIVGALHVPVTVSIGVADDLGGHEETFTDGFGRADVALYRAKHNGRNRVEIGAPPNPPYAGDAI